MILVFSTVWLAALSPSAASPPHNSPTGVFSTTNFLAPLMGGIGNILILTLLIFSFSSTSGSQINPMITLATFFARLISFPRMIIYIGCQTLGAALAGFVLTTAYGSRDFLTGGCVVNTELVPVKDAFVLEFMYCLMLIFISFGVGLDPRQAQIFGPALSPWLVGLGLGVTSWGSAYTRVGYGGACKWYLFLMDGRVRADDLLTKL
jgi:glycerol uptake facilitator-like aquaporin